MLSGNHAECYILPLEDATPLRRALLFQSTLAVNLRGQHTLVRYGRIDEAPEVLLHNFEARNNQVDRNELI